MTGSLSRRAVVRGAAAAGAALALPVGTAGSANAADRRRVAVFGAGMAGLAAAHELAERGFKVDVYERNSQLGGKARSFGVPGTGTGGRRPLPAEHGFRFFPGFYQNVTDSMQRTPRPTRGDTAFDSLRDLADLMDGDGFGGALTFGPGQSLAAFAPLDLKRLRITDPGRLADPGFLVTNLTAALTVLAGLPAGRLPGEFIDFAAKCLVYITSSDERRRGQWDHITWWNYLGTPHKSKFFEMAIARGTTQDLVAVKPEICAVSSGGNIIDAFTWNILGMGLNSRTAWILRFLDGPTSDVWLDPWIRHLERLGVRFHRGQTLESLRVRRGRIEAAQVVSAAGVRRRVDADWFLAALPVDKALPILTAPDLLKADPRLAGIKDLKVDWMNGMQIYLRRPLEIARGVLGTLDHPWTLSAVAQSQLWRHSIAQRYGDGTVTECLSIDISTWDKAGGTTVVGKAARDCTKQEVFKEIWTTLKDRFGALDSAFRDDNLHSWYLDPALQWSGGTTGTVTNDETLTVQTAGTWAKRPTGRTRIPNLFVAGDWIQNNANVCCMEAGNEAGRYAAQYILDASGHRARDVQWWDYYQPPALDPMKRLDALRYRHGQPNIFEGISQATGAFAGLSERVEARIKQATRK